MSILRESPPLLQEIRAGRRATVYLIVGDPALTRPVHQQLLQVLIPEGSVDFNWEQVDGEKEELSAILERLQTYAIFPGPKVVSVKNLSLLTIGGDNLHLLEKARACWENGEPLSALRLLFRLWSENGLSAAPPGPAGTLKLKEAALKVLRKINPDLDPGWVVEAIDFKEAQGLSAPPDPEMVLEQALRAGFPEGHTLILVSDRVGRQKKIVKLIAEIGVLLDLTFPSGSKKDQVEVLNRLLKNLVGREGKTLDPQAEALLRERVGFDPGSLEMEIRKLSTYAGDRSRITREDVDLLVPGNREEPLYELTTALGDGKPLEALRILHRLWEQGFHPLAIVSGVTNAYRRFLFAREALEGLPASLGRFWKSYPEFTRTFLPRLQESGLPGGLAKLHAYALFNLLEGARRFSREHLFQDLKALRQMDRRLKTSGVDGRLLLEAFILNRGR